MARRKIRASEAEWQALEIPAIPTDAWVLAPSPVRLADGGFEAVESPARALQADLAASWEARSSDRWSPRRALAVMVVGSVVAWAILIATVRAIFF